MSNDLYVPETNKGLFAYGAGWVLAILALIGVIGLILWGTGVLFAGPAGQAGAYKQKESANNRVFAQANFVQLNEDIGGYISKVAIAKQALADDRANNAPDEQLQIDRTNLEGVRQICVDAVQQYNADSQKYLLRDFKSAGLPYRHDREECLNA